MDKTRALALAAALLLSISVAHAQPIGDFGRPRPGVVTDTIMPAIDGLGDWLAGRPQSDLLWTDEEDEMHDRIWRFLVAPYSKDWGIRYRVNKASADAGFGSPKRPSRYYEWLREAGFVSSHARYNAITQHAGQDIGTLPGVFAAICTVEDIDRQRGIAVAELPDLEPRYAERQALRDAQNEEYISRFVLVLDYRYQSYSYALDRLLVETPHREAIGADAALSELGGWVDRARARDFCSGPSGWGGHDADPAIRSRVLITAPSEGTIPK